MGYRSCCFSRKDLRSSTYGCWSSIPNPNLVDLQRSGQKCRLQWMNCLKRGVFSLPGQNRICKGPTAVKKGWLMDPKLLPGRTDNKIGRIWNSCVQKKGIHLCIDQNNDTPINSSIASQISEKIASYTENNIEDSTEFVKEKNFQFVNSEGVVGRCRSIHSPCHTSKFDETTAVSEVLERNNSYELNMLVETAQDLSCYRTAELPNWSGQHSQTERDATDSFIWENLPAMIEEEESGAPNMKMNKMGRN